METMAKNDRGTKGNRGKKGVEAATHAVHASHRAKTPKTAPCVPEEVAYLHDGMEAILERVRGCFTAADRALEEFTCGYDWQERNSPALTELAPHEAPIRELCEQVRGIVREMPAPSDELIEQQLVRLGPLFAAASSLCTSIQKVWSQFERLVDAGVVEDDDYDAPIWLLEAAKAVNTVNPLFEIAYAALTVARLRAGEPVRTAV
jgi:hypothetical protein